MTIINISLITHVLIGVVGVIASYAVVMGLLKKTLPITYLKTTSLIAFISYMLSWASGGYYYVVRYGSEVKPLIKGGDYSWAHSVLMESKEHIFLFLPALSFVIVLVIWLYGSSLQENTSLKRVLTYIAFTVLFIGIFIAISGILISGAAR